MKVDGRKHNLSALGRTDTKVRKKSGMASSKQKRMKLMRRMNGNELRRLMARISSMMEMEKRSHEMGDAENNKGNDAEEEQEQEVENNEQDDETRMERKPRIAFRQNMWGSGAR